MNEAERAKARRGLRAHHWRWDCLATAPTEVLAAELMRRLRAEVAAHEEATRRLGEAELALHAFAAKDARAFMTRATVEEGTQP